MNIAEKAKEYAKGENMSELASLIEQAFADGYNEGFNDALTKKEILPDYVESDGVEAVDFSNTDALPNKVTIDGVEYVDLGLPSGTKWAAEYKKVNGSVVCCNYEEASKMNIPTIEQYCELFINSKFLPSHKASGETDGVTLIGPNGNEVTYKDAKLFNKNLEYSFPQLWLRLNHQDNHQPRHERHHPRRSGM